jgi:phage shock protein PspC (stress-responsive transcriptional regulator)
MENIKYSIEKSAFGVCSYIGEKFGISSNKIRLYFIYASCLTIGSPLIVYLVMAFWINLKKYIKQERTILNS